jgi:hypothetical protein
VIVRCSCGYAPQIDHSTGEPFTQYATYQMEVGLHIMVAVMLRLPGTHEAVRKQ